MALNVESCSREEACASFGQRVEVLDELRAKLQDWLRLQPHLPQDVSEALLESLLLGTKMSLEQAKRKLDMYYTIKRLVPELFANRDPRGSSLNIAHTMIETAYLPKLTPEKYRVCILRPYVNDYSKFNAFDSSRYMLMIEDMLMNDPTSRSLGSIYVFDHSSITLNFVTKYTPAIVRKSEVAAVEAYAKRIKGIYFVNASPFTEMMVTLGKKVLKPKLAARIHTYCKGNDEALCQRIPKSILPKDYGGEELSVSHLAELWRQRVDEKRDWFLKQEKIMADEALRPGPAFDGDDLFGFSGSFRKLDVD